LDHRADRLAFVHQVEGGVDLIERHHVGDEVIDVDLAVHVPVHDFGHVGAAACAAEGGAFPDASGDELERAGGDFLTRFGDADDDALAPAAVGGFQRLAHYLDVAGAIESVVCAAAGDVDDGLDYLVFPDV